MQKFIEKTIKQAGGIAKKYFLNGVKHTIKSSPSDVVTIADTFVESFLIKKILKKFPNHGIIGEELGEINSQAEYVWVIDPIDGTRNFAKGIPFWCVMIGLEKKGRPWIGAIYDPLNKDFYYAEVGKGAFKNGKRIKVNKTKEVDQCFFAFSAGTQDVVGSPYYAPEHPRYAKFMRKLMGTKGFWISHYNSILSLCHLADGGLDAFAMCSGLYHDYLSAYVIATEAGAKFTDSYGKTWKKGRMDVLVANPVLHKKLLGLF